MIKKGVLIVNELEKENEMNTKKEKQPTFNNRGYIITIKILIWLVVSFPMLLLIHYLQL